MLLVILLFGMFASIFTFQKYGLMFTEPYFLVGSRMFVAGIILELYFYLKHKKTFFKVGKKAWFYLVILGLFNIYLTNILEIWATKSLKSSEVCLLYSLSPFVASVIAFLVLKERLSLTKFAGMLIGFTGLLPIIMSQTTTEEFIGELSVFTWAEIAMIGAVSSSVYGWIILKKIMRDFDLSPVHANGISMLIGGVLAMTQSYLMGETWDPIPVTDYKSFLFASGMMLLISNMICYNLYGYLLKKFSASFMSFAGLVTPIFSSLYGWIWLHEVVTWHFFLSVALFGCGLTIFYGDERKIQKLAKAKKHTS